MGELVLLIVAAAWAAVLLPPLAGRALRTALTRQ